ncbi:hypothetical protein HY030_03490 [Candidatus Gottesmanbacteria bacterium]|nr:hypothetical protein [Candidatus Gottesmanbacteria bacterium]
MIELVSFIVLIFLLSYFRTQIAFLIQGISLLVFERAKPGVIFYSILFLPGILIHELSHLLTAELLGIRTGRINIFPTEIKAGNTEGTFGVKMGFVESEETDPFRETLIGSAPFLVGLFLITVIVFMRFSALDSIFSSEKILNLTSILLLYLIFSVGNTMFVSEEDKRGWWFIPMILVIVLAFIYGFRIRLNLEGVLSAGVKNLQFVNRALFLCLGLDVFFLVGLFLIRKAIESLTGKRLLTKTG